MFELDTILVFYDEPLSLHIFPPSSMWQGRAGYVGCDVLDYLNLMRLAYSQQLYSDLLRWL